MSDHWSDEEDEVFRPRHYVTIEEAKEKDFAHLMAAEAVKDAERKNEFLRWTQEDVEAELDDEEYDALLDAVLTVQQAYRGRRSRQQMSAKVRAIWQPHADKFTGHRVYRNRITGEETTRKPLLLHGDAYHHFLADEDAAVALQCWARTCLARALVKVLIHEVYTAEFDDTSGYYYYYNHRTGAMSWEKPAVLRGRDLYPGHPIKEKLQCEAEELAKRSNPPVISGVRCQAAAALLLGDKGNTLVRYNVHVCSAPERYVITRDEADEAAGWTRVLSFFAFAQAMPKAVRHWTEKASGITPLRNRLKNPYAKLLRDISAWEATGDEFWAYISPMPGTALLNLHWTPSPDRYMISASPKPKLCWQQRFCFYAYTATKYYVHRAVSSGVERYRVTQEGPDETWSYLFSFYGFDHQVPGTLNWRVQEKYDEEYGVTVSKFTTSATEHSGWFNVGMCCAFDMPVPGTTKYCLYLATKPSRYRIEPENVFPNQREWQHVADLYAFPGGPMD